MAPKPKAATRGVKRTAGDEASKSVPKQSRVDPDVQVVKDVIESAEDFPESCKAMLLAILPSTLCVPRDERIAFQARAVAMIGEVIEAQRVSLQTAVDVEQAKLVDLEHSKSQLEAKVSEADAALKEASDALANNSLAADDAAKSSQDARVALDDAKVAQATGDVQLEKIEAERRDMREALETLLPNLSGEQFQVDAAPGHRDAIMGVLGRSSQAFESTLLMTLPDALIKPPTERGSFDTMAIETLEANLNQCVEKLNASIQVAEVAKNEQVAAVEVAAARVNDTQEAEVAALNAVRNAEESKRIAIVALEAEKARRQNFEPSFASAVAARDAKQAILTSFEEHNLKSFTTLESKHSAAVMEKVGKLGA